MRKILLAFLLLLPKVTFASFSTPIAHTIAGSTDGLNVTTSAITTSTATLIVIGVSDIDTADYVLTDSKSNTWTYTGTQYAATLSARVKMYYCINPTVGTGHTFTVTALLGTTFPTISVAAFAGVKVSSPLDTQNGASNAGSTTLATGSITPSEDNELVISFMSSESTSGPYSIDSGFTLIDGNVEVVAQHFGGALAYKIQSNAAAVNPTWTTGSSAGIADTILSFKAAANMFDYSLSLTVTSDTALLPSSQTDFPLLISFTNNGLKDTAHSGHVQSSLGYDIRPYSGITALTFQLELYDPVTGQVIIWTKDPTISVGQIVTLKYGNLALVADGSSTSTWDSNYVAAFHLNEALFTSTVTSGTGAGDLTGQGVTKPTSTTGKIGLGMASGSTGYLSGSGTPYQDAAITYQAWVNPTVLSGGDGYSAVMQRWDNPGGGCAFQSQVIYHIKDSGKLEADIHAVTSGCSHINYDGTGATTLSTGTWYLLTMVYDAAGGMIVYVNGAVDKTVATDGSGVYAVTAGTFAIAAATHVAIANEHLNASFDEVHVSNIARSADWIKAEYNNQNDPTTFLTIGSEASSSGLNTKLLMGVGK